MTKFREYEIPIADGGTSYLQIDFCPFCGSKLPASLRNKWFAAIEAMGIDPITDEITGPYASDQWWSGITPEKR